MQLYTTGNLYYALTHSPEPLTEEYSHALSWEAATERLAAAGSVSVAEAEAMEEALKSAEAGIDVSLTLPLCIYLLVHKLSLTHIYSPFTIDAPLRSLYLL